MASDFVPELSEKYADVTIAHFLTMTSGYTAVGDSTNGSYKHGPSSTPYLPGNPLFVPGSRYSYWDSAMNEFALVLTIAAGEPLDSFFMKRVARMIGIEDNNWWWGDFGIHNANKINSGAGNLDRNIFISATDFARFGHLFLNNGNWNGKQIISRNWVDEANSVQVPASVKQGTPLSPIDGSGIYGFNWWVTGTNADGQKNWPDAPDKTYSASGYNNNDMFVIPEWDMVVVRMGLDQQEIAISNMVYSKFLGLIGESIFKK
jgi:CubicO group peptidase (beta-lactamase class C family)